MVLKDREGVSLSRSLWEYAFNGTMVFFFGLIYAWSVFVGPLETRGTLITFFPKPLYTIRKDYKDFGSTSIRINGLK
jgi:hypothetical protein